MKQRARPSEPAAVESVDKLQDDVAEAATLSNRLVLATIETVERLGMARARFLELVQFDPARLASAEGRVSTREFSRLCEFALDLSEDPALGLREGARMSGAAFNIVSPLVGHAATLRQGFAALLQFHKLLHSQPRYQVSERADGVTLCCARMEGVSARVGRFMAEVELTAFCKMIGFFGAGARPVRVCFEHAAPDYRNEYTRVFEGLEHFEQPFTGIVFDRALLDAPSLFKDEGMQGAIRAQAEQRVAQLTQSVCYAERVREIIARGAPSRIDMETIAPALGLSVRSLRRRLAAERTSYQALVNQALASVAKRHLLIERRTIQETAYAMGYADSGAFHRAFKRWTGMTPSAFIAQR